jgi:hypothetical protein
MFAPSPFDAANGFLSGASAIFFRAAIALGIERPDRRFEAG